MNDGVAKMKPEMKEASSSRAPRDRGQGVCMCRTGRSDREPASEYFVRLRDTSCDSYVTVDLAPCRMHMLEDDAAEKHAKQA